MKVQAVDMTELRRRIDQQIYDEAELEMALAWADKNFRYGEDENNKQYQRNAEQSRAVLRESLLMAMCIRDMMQGNSKLADIGRVYHIGSYLILTQRHVFFCHLKLCKKLSIDHMLFPPVFYPDAIKHH